MLVPFFSLSQIKTIISRCNNQQFKLPSRHNVLVSLNIHDKKLHELYGIYAFSRVYTPAGKATVVGIGTIDQSQQLCFLLDEDSGISYWGNLEKQPLAEQQGFALLPNDHFVHPTLRKSIVEMFDSLGPFDMCDTPFTLYSHSLLESEALMLRWVLYVNQKDIVNIEKELSACVDDLHKLEGLFFCYHNHSFDDVERIERLRRLKERYQELQNDIVMSREINKSLIELRIAQLEFAENPQQLTRNALISKKKSFILIIAKNYRSRDLLCDLLNQKLITDDHDLRKEVLIILFNRMHELPFAILCDLAKRFEQFEIPSLLPLDSIQHAIQIYIFVINREDIPFKYYERTQANTQLQTLLTSNWVELAFEAQDFAHRLAYLHCAIQSELAEQSFAKGFDVLFLLITQLQRRSSLPPYQVLLLKELILFFFEKGLLAENTGLIDLKKASKIISCLTIIQHSLQPEQLLNFKNRLQVSYKTYLNAEIKKLFSQRNSDPLLLMEQHFLIAIFKVLNTGETISTESIAALLKERWNWIKTIQNSVLLHWFFLTSPITRLCIEVTHLIDCENRNTLLVPDLQKVRCNPFTDKVNEVELDNVLFSSDFQTLYCLEYLLGDFKETGAAHFLKTGCEKLFFYYDEELHKEQPLPEAETELLYQLKPITKEVAIFAKERAAKAKMTAFGIFCELQRSLERSSTREKGEELNAYGDVYVAICSFLDWFENKLDSDIRKELLDSKKHGVKLSYILDHINRKNITKNGNILIEYCVASNAELLRKWINAHEEQLKLITTDVKTFAASLDLKSDDYYYAELMSESKKPINATLTLKEIHDVQACFDKAQPSKAAADCSPPQERLFLELLAFLTQDIERLSNRIAKKVDRELLVKIDEFKKIHDDLINHFPGTNLYSNVLCGFVNELVKVAQKRTGWDITFLYKPASQLNVRDFVRRQRLLFMACGLTVDEYLRCSVIACPSEKNQVKV